MKVIEVNESLTLGNSDLKEKVTTNKAFFSAIKGEAKYAASYKNVLSHSETRRD